MPAANQCFSKAIIVFMRYPELGRVKSRLACTIGNDRALALYEGMVRATLGAVDDYRSTAGDVKVFIACTPSDRTVEMKTAFPGPWEIFPQEGAHLGQRMGNAMRHVFHMGLRHVVLVGTDLAHPERVDYSRAFRALDRGFIPLGPAADGGFYLIGLGRPCEAPFGPETWGEGSIYDRSRRLLEEEGLPVQRLAEMVDVDREEDLKHLLGNPVFQSNLSVIVPSLQDTQTFQGRIAILERCLWPGDEIIVVLPNGCKSPPDGTGSARTGYFQAPRGRGLQMNHGAERSGNELLFFLHDDAAPPLQFSYLIRKTLAAPHVALGYFSLEFSPSNPSLQAIAHWANFRSSALKLPYGDQGFFCRKEMFRASGGFQEAMIMEDVDFVRRCKEKGKLQLLSHPITTSSRRYLSKGILKASLLNHLMLALYHLGVDNERLYSLYYGSESLKALKAEASTRKQ